MDTKRGTVATVRVYGAYRPAGWHRIVHVKTCTGAFIRLAPRQDERLYTVARKV